MKRLLLLIALISGVASARADLVMREQADFGNPTNLMTITIQIHGNKIRQDLTGAESDDMSLIKDADTGDCIVLMPQQKMFAKPAAKIRNAQSPEAALTKPQDTGKSASVDGYDAEIFAWAADRKLWNDTNGMTETLWVAKAYPSFGKIKPYLAKLDRANASFPGKAMQPEISTLPGMVLKSEVTVKMGNLLQTVSYTLVSAKEEPVDPSVFKVPGDYKEATPSPPPGPSAPTPAPNKSAP
jgi:hypothetical protein